jgi:hypothetical protein
VSTQDPADLLAERDSLLRDWVAEQGQRTAAEARAERAELERDRLRADVAELVKFLGEVAKRGSLALSHDASALLAKHREPA